MWRPGSPSPGGSTLITSAPWSAIAMVRYGPGRNTDRSTTFTPSSFIVASQVGAAGGFRSRAPTRALRTDGQMGPPSTLVIPERDRKGSEEGKRVSVRFILGGGR